jgi:hypothetical protein
MNAVDLDEWIRQQVGLAPDLTDEQAGRLAAILRPADRTTRTGTG